MRLSLSQTLAAGLLLAALSASAQTLVLNSTSVIGGGPTYDNPVFNQGTFPATFVVNEQNGVIGNDIFGGNYWLGPDGVTSDYFVIDLGAAFTLGQIELYNTHNNGAFDRSTVAFHIDGANSVSFVDANHGSDLSSATRILSGTLPFNNDPLVDNIFTAANGLNTGGVGFRFIRFTFDSFAGQGGSAGLGGGLHEIVFTAVPEPSTWVLLGLGVMAMLPAIFRRKRAR